MWGELYSLSRRGHERLIVGRGGKLLSSQVGEKGCAFRPACGVDSAGGKVKPSNRPCLSYTETKADPDRPNQVCKLI